MARDFNGSTQFLDAGQAVVSGSPFTVSFWANRDAVIDTNEDRQFSISDASATDEYRFYTLESAGTDYLIWGAYDGSTHDSFIATSPAAGEWHHYVGVEEGTTRNLYYDGTIGTVNNDTVTLSGLDETTIGAAQISSGSNYHFNGQLAEAAIWNVALTQAEITMLSLGVSPLFVRPQSLVSYWRVIGRDSPEMDLVGGTGMVLNNSPAVAVHPRVIYPSPPQIITSPAVGAVAKSASGAMIMSAALSKKLSAKRQVSGAI